MITEKEKQNILDIVRNSTLFDGIDGAKGYIVSLIAKDIEYNSSKYITLKNAIETYGDDNLLYHYDDPDAIGTVTDNWKGCTSIVMRAAFHYTFHTVYVTRDNP